MSRPRSLPLLARWTVLGLTIAGMAVSLVPAARGSRAPVVNAQNESGTARTINMNGPVVDDDNPFFADLGVNGRRCITCHSPQQNMTVTPAALQARFEASDGTDPIFRPNDGSNSPLEDVSTPAARRAAYSMLLDKGVIRVGIAIPATAEFELASVNDPYGYAGHNTSSNELSLFRRPLPATNLRFLSTVMWDGRETTQRGTAEAIHFDLDQQANDATTGHAQAPLPIDQATRDAIVAYQTGNFTAQVFDQAAGDLHSDGAQGGPENLIPESFVFGANDPLGCDANGLNCTGANDHFTGMIFDEYDAWAAVPGGGRNAARRAVARGQTLFNTLEIPITGVGGINDDFKVPTVKGNCGVCHDTPHAGDHSVPAPLNIGIADPPGADGVHTANGLDVSGMPVYTLRNKTTGQTKVVTDPGRALITGRWSDVGRFKGPILRGLAGRAPYFHNGSAATLLDVVNFYDKRFNLALTDAQKSDLVAFLRTL
jgi:cytochrome c peroxidase